MLPSSFNDSNVCIIGLGYVGLTLAVAMADVGIKVHGVERDPSIVDCIKSGHAHFHEAGLDIKLAQQVNDGRLSVSNTMPTNSRANVYIVTVGTPVGEDKRVKFEALNTVIDSITHVIKDGDMVILRSTVKVGTTAKIVAPVLDKVGVRYDLAFCPERTLEGRALQELRTLPQIVGGRTDSATHRASQLFGFVTPTTVKVRDLETAELIKLVNNTSRDLSFAFSNEIAEVSDALGLTAKDVIAAANLGYPRSNLPLPGPVGGPCLEKDPYILAESVEPFGMTPLLTLSGRKINENLLDRTKAAISDCYTSVSATTPKRIAILGVAFKGRPATSDLRGTLAVSVIRSLKDKFPTSEIVGWDAAVDADGVASLGVTSCATLEEAFTGSDIVVIQNNHEQFETMTIERLSGLMNTPSIIYDYWNQRDATSTKLSSEVTYFGLGTKFAANS